MRGVLQAAADKNFPFEARIVIYKKIYAMYRRETE